MYSTAGQLVREMQGLTEHAKTEEQRDASQIIKSVAACILKL
jgi:hypothetical protein